MFGGGALSFNRCSLLSPNVLPSCGVEGRVYVLGAGLSGGRWGSNFSPMRAVGGMGFGRM